MSQHNLIHQLVSCLSELESDLTTLDQVLQQEQSVLTEHRTDELEKLAESKTRLTHQIEQTEKTRIGLCHGLNIKPDKNALIKWLVTQPESMRRQIAVLWTHITALGQKCSAQNQVNGILVSHHQRHIKEALNVLRGSVVGNDEYSAKGVHQTNFSHNIIGKV